MNLNGPYALSLFLENSKLIDNNKGLPIGVCKPDQCPPILTSATSLYLINFNDLSYIDPRKIRYGNISWQRVSQEDIYDSTIGWLNAGNLKSTFYPTKYLREKIPF